MLARGKSAHRKARCAIALPGALLHVEGKSPPSAPLPAHRAGASSAERAPHTANGADCG